MTSAIESWKNTGPMLVDGATFGHFRPDDSRPAILGVDARLGHSRLTCSGRPRIGALTLSAVDSLARTSAPATIEHKDLGSMSLDRTCNPPLYSAGTWDMEMQAYTPQACSPPAVNIDRRQLRVVLKSLRRLGYSAHRRRCEDGSYDDNDFYVLVERTDGMPEAEILEAWKR